MVATNFNGPVQDISIDDAVAGSTAGLDEFMASCGFAYDPTALVPLTLPGLFGDGSDGDVDIGAGTTTLARDMYYNDLTIPNGGILKPNGRRIYVAGRLTIEAGGSINADGGAAAAGVPGTAGAIQATWTQGTGEGGLGQPAAGSAGEAVANAVVGFAGVGGDGGAGSGGAGGAGGAVTALNTATYGNQRAGLDAILSGAIGSGNVQRLGCGSGGGGGGGNGATAGGCGGGGGGGVKIDAREIVNDGTIQAIGGAGETPVDETVLVISSNPEEFADGDWPEAIFNGGRWRFSFTFTNDNTGYIPFGGLFAQSTGGLWVATQALQLYDTSDVLVFSQPITFSALQTLTFTLDMVAQTVEIAGATTGDGVFGFANAGPYWSTGAMKAGGAAGVSGFAIAGTFSNVESLADNCGGGGGGGGGLVVTAQRSYTGNLPDVAGGAPGLGNGTGDDGAQGAAGLYIPLQL